jgi:hypothetical protein
VTSPADDLHRLVDRLPPAQVRHLRALVDADPELAPYVEEDEQRSPGLTPALEAFLGGFSSGRDDVAENHEQLIGDGLQRDQ